MKYLYKWSNHTKIRPGSVFLAFLLFSSLSLSLALAACGNEVTSTLPTASPTALPTSTPIPTVTPTALPTSTSIPTASPTALPTSTPVPTVTPTLVPTATSIPTSTALPISASVPTRLATTAAAGGPNVTPVGPTATVNPVIKEFLQRAATAQGKVNTVHFSLEVKTGKAEVRGAELRQAEGDIKRPEDFQATVKVASLFGPISVEVVGLNQEQYSTNPITGEWLKAGKDDYIKLGALLDPREGVSNVLLNLRDPKFIGSDIINGEPLLHYQGIADGKLIAPLTIYTLGKYNTTLDIWINSKTNLVQQIDLKEIEGPATWTIKFSRYDEPVTIKKPKI